MIQDGRWTYDPSRFLNIHCKTPYEDDEDLVHYKVSPEVADAQLLTDYIVTTEKRKSRGRSKVFFIFLS